MKPRLIVLLVILMCVNVFSISAQLLKVQPIGVELSQEELAEMNRTLLYQKRQLAKLYGEQLGKQFTARVFGDFGAYSEYSLDCCSFQPIATAYYNQEVAELVIFKNEEFMKAFRHELCHALTARKSIQDHPWLDEGLAEVLSAKQINEKGEIREELLYPTKDLKAINTPKIRRLFAANREAWQKMTNTDSYAMAWAVVNYLSGHESALLGKIVLAAETDANLKEVIDKEFEGGLKALVRSMQTYYKSR